jgi:hypothetical protein
VIEVISGDPGAYEDHDLITKTEALSLEHDEILQGMIDKFPIVEIREVKSRGY